MCLTESQLLDRLFLEAAFGDDEIGSGMQSFLSDLLRARPVLQRVTLFFQDRYNELFRIVEANKRAGPRSGHDTIDPRVNTDINFIQEIMAELRDHRGQQFGFLTISPYLTGH